MNFIMKIWRWLFGKKKPKVEYRIVEADGNIIPLPEPIIVNPPEVQKTIKDPRSMTAYERQVYYGMGYKQFEKYKQSL